MTPEKKDDKKKDNDKKEYTKPEVSSLGKVKEAALGATFRLPSD